MKLLDTLRSLVTGLGTAKDRTTSLSYAMTLVSDAELNAMHRSDWLARKIVDIIPNDMTREWRDWQAEGTQIELIEGVEAAPLINTQAKVNQAMRAARLLRGSAIYMGLKNAKPEEPLELDSVKKGDLLYLNVLNRSEVSIGELIKDVTSEFYGEPEFYEVNSSAGLQLRIHPSRMIRFIGAEVLDKQLDNDNWGDSVLQIVYNAIQNATSVQQHIASLIPEAKTDVIYIPRLSEFLRDPRTTQQLTDRFAYANSIKSMFNMVLLEGDGQGTTGEKWEQKQIGFAQLPEILQQFLQIASGAADIPVTRLLGQSPSGLNSTGESDIRNYYDNLSSRQKTELSPNLHRLDEVTIRSALGSRPPEIYYTWSPLWSISEMEKATIFSTKVTAVRNIAGPTVPLMPIDALSDALVNTLIEDSSLPGLETAIEEFGKLSEQKDHPTEADVKAAMTPPKPAAVVGQKPGEKDKNGNVIPFKKKAATDAEPATLYVRRDVLNAADITAWAKGQGMTDIVDDLHVTVVYSRAPFDWIKAGNAGEFGYEQDGKLTIPAGGPRVVEPLGNMSAVLMFASSSLCWRHEEIIRAGASHDYADYQPHISLTKAQIDLDEVEPYRGAIILGPEIFEELDTPYGDANPYHEPAGSSIGGRFASKLGGKFEIGSVAPKGEVHPKAAGDDPHLNEVSQKLTGYEPAELTGIIARGVPLKVSLSSAVVHPGENGVSYTWHMQNETGKRVGKLERTFVDAHIDALGRPQPKTVQHDEFELQDNYTASGIGKTVLGNSMAVYEKAGVEKVSVYASAARGGYAWAKFGFRPNENDWASRSLDRTRVRAREAGLEDLITSDPKSIWKLADRPQGKRALSGTAWKGFLDMKDPEAMSRFYTYVNKESKPKDGFTDADPEMLDETEIMQSIIDEVDGVRDANPYHEPAGSEKGGRFAKRPGTGLGEHDDPGDLSEDINLVRRFAAAQAAADAIPSTEHINTPERDALRARIADELYNKDIGKRSRNREATIILGLPGVGKSTFANPLLANGALEVDPDLAKALIPEFAGGVGAFAVHEESSMIARKVLGRAISNGDDFVWPRIDNPGRLRSDIESLRTAGYKVNVTFIDTDPQVAIRSVIDRFEKTGRYVSPLVVKNYGDSPREASVVAQQMNVDKYEEYYRPLEGDTRRVK